MTLRGRDSVLRTLRELRGGAVLVRGGAGSGKSALLAVLRAEPGRRVLGVRGLRAERGLSRGALSRMFPTAVADGPAVHRTLVGAPTLCWVDDAQWLDEESLAALAFAARRLNGHPVSMLLASTSATDLFDELVLPPLSSSSADSLLQDHGVPAGLRPQLVELAGGNPADLVELAASLTPAQVAGREPVSEVLESRLAGYAAHLAALPPAERILVISRAAESTVDLSGASKATRSTWYAAATPADRRQAHALLVAELDGPNQIWHRAMAAGSPSLATELASAPAADHATAARQLERAAALTVDPSVRATRMLAAARAAWQAGRPGWSRLLLSRVDAPQGEATLLHGEIELRDGDPAVATHELTTAAALLANPAPALLLAGEARRLSGDLHGYRRLATQIPDERDARSDRLMRSHFRGLAATFVGDHHAAAAPLEEVVQLGLQADDVASAVWAAEAAFALGHGERAHECAAAAVGRARLAKEHAQLPWALVFFALSAIVLDRLSCATAAAREGMAGPHNLRMEHLTLLGLAAALTGVRAAELDEAAPGIAARGLGRPAAVAAWAYACLDLAEDRPADAFGRLTDLAGGVSGDQPAIRVLATPQLVEAAVRADRPDAAHPSLDIFDRWTRAGGSPAWLALNHRCHALVATDTGTAEQHFTTAINYHRRAGSGMELARTQLAYATMLRRRRRAKDARDLFRDALRGFEKVGAHRYVERARAGLRATGETTAPPRTTLAGLTPQQAEISRLVAVGETNKEIARKLVISHRTVDHHLRNIFTALGVRSRVELARRVAANERTHSTP